MATGLFDLPLIKRDFQRSKLFLCRQSDCNTNPKHHEDHWLVGLKLERLAALSTAVAKMPITLTSYISIVLSLLRTPNTLPTTSRLPRIHMNPFPSARPPSSVLGYHHSFHTSPSLLANHFDTHQFVEQLMREGLSQQQAEGVMAALAEVVDESIASMSSTMVTKAEQEKVRAAARQHRRLVTEAFASISCIILRKSTLHN